MRCLQQAVLDQEAKHRNIWCVGVFALHRRQVFFVLLSTCTVGPISAGLKGAPPSSAVSTVQQTMMTAGRGHQVQLNQCRQRRNAGRNGPAQRIIHQVELLQLLRAHAAANSATNLIEMQGRVGPLSTLFSWLICCRDSACMHLNSLKEGSIRHALKVFCLIGERGGRTFT